MLFREVRAPRAQPQFQHRPRAPGCAQLGPFEHGQRRQATDCRCGPHDGLQHPKRARAHHAPSLPVRARARYSADVAQEAPDILHAALTFGLDGGGNLVVVASSGIDLDSFEHEATGHVLLSLSEALAASERAITTSGGTVGAAFPLLVTCEPEGADPARDFGVRIVDAVNTAQVDGPCSICWWRISQVLPPLVLPPAPP